MGSYISYHVTYIKLTFDRFNLHQWENIMVHQNHLQTYLQFDLL